jgi:chromate transport protein ChrA
MNKYMPTIIFLAVIIFLLRHNSVLHWLYIVTAVLASYLSIFIIERYRKLNYIGKYLVFIFVSAPILNMIIPVSHIVILYACGLALTIYRNADDASNKKKNN